MPGRSPDLTTPDDKKVRGVTGRHETLRVEHQRLVRARRESLHERHDLVEFAVAVEFLVERVGRRTPHARGKESDARPRHVRVGAFMLGNYHNVGAADDQTRVLRRRFFVATRDHQPYVNVSVHVVLTDGFVEGRFQLGFGFADV